jgi:hypothetical protein
MENDPNKNGKIIGLLNPQERFQAAYRKWTETFHLVDGVLPDHLSTTSIQLRNEAWQNYCDARDYLERSHQH